MSSTFLYLDTRHALNPSEPSVGSWPLNMQLSQFSRTHIQVSDLAFANTVYPINVNNNILIYEENSASSTTTSTITIQNYSGPQFATELQTQMNTDTQEGTVYTVTYNSQTKKISIVTDGNDFRISSASSCLDEIGLDYTGMSVASTSAEMLYPVQLGGSNYVDVVSNLSVKNINTSGRSNILARVYITVPFGSIQTYQNSTEDKIPLFSEELSSLELRLIDEKGNLWELPPNSHAAYSMKLSFN
jgi:hypothetical protein